MTSDETTGVNTAEQVEYRVRPVYRFVVTKYVERTVNGKLSGSVETFGEFANEVQANKVCHALYNADPAENKSRTGIDHSGHTDPQS
jgi:hypothetical protein